jgi:hypothetical protein
MFKRLLPFLLCLLVPLLFATPALATFEMTHVGIGVQNENGSPDVQAGSHPYSITTTFVLQKFPFEENAEHVLKQLPEDQGELKEVVAWLPPGFVGNPNAVPKCKYAEFIAGASCPADTAVGIDRVYLHAPVAPHGGAEEIFSYPSAVFNMEPSPGEPAEFAFEFEHSVPVFLNASVRTGEDYGITVTAPNLSESGSVYASKVTIWGVPAAASHNALRGEGGEQGGCLSHQEYYGEPGLIGAEAEQETPGLYESECTGSGGSVSVPVEPLLTNPTSCGAPRTAKLTVASWQEPPFPPILPSSKEVSLPPLLGCEKLNFSPSIDVQPDGAQGSTPTGLNVEVHVPQESTENPEGLGEADVKNTTVTLPAGVQISPAAADGLQACSDAQIGFEGYREFDESGVQTPAFTPDKPTCPDASKLATVHIKTPLLEEELEGEVYLAAPQNFAGFPENPFSSLIAMYLVAEDQRAGVLLKLPGKVEPNPVTGQLTTTFENTPQLPFTDLKLEFFGTDRAPLATPALCGTYTTETSFEPWSAPPGGTSSSSTKNPSSTFQITSGPGGAPCADPLPFSPTLQSGATNINAGSFSDLTTTLSREDGEQSIQQVTLHYPAGLSGLLSGVALCGEQQANEGTCTSASQIGETIVSVGLGNDPFTVTGGKVYITGPYEGAPFGLSIVNPAKAGPFDLQEGRPVIVRAKIEVNPVTAALTVTTNGGGGGSGGVQSQGYAIPRIIEGIPLQIKHVNVNITRPGFTFNPTNCNPTEVTGTVASAEGASSPVSIPFQVTNCASLKFAPKFSVSTSGKTSKALGADLVTKVSYPSAAQGTYANVAKVKVELPKQLPSRLTTLQKACTDTQF